ncbi:class F sortase [Nocardioides montaniterrae]
MLAGLVVLAAGGLWWTHSSTAVPTSAADTATAGPRAPVAHEVPRVPGAPRRLRIPAIHVDAPVVAVAAAGRTLVPPSDPMTLGWWAAGSEPGAARGTTLIAGHTVHNGPGALNDLADLDVGRPLVITTSHGADRYRVTRVHTFAKGIVAADAERLFRQTGPPRLVVVTCSDWNGTRYLSNTIVTARPVVRLG